MNPPAEFPADAYPRAFYASGQHITPDTVRVNTSAETLTLWIGGDMIGVPRDADDTRLQAALHLAEHLTQMAQRYGSLVRAELDQRAQARQAGPVAAAMPDPAPAPAVPAPTRENLFTPKTASQAAAPQPRYCTGCGNLLHPSPDQPAAAGASPTGPEDTRPECPRCRASLLAEQVRGRADQPPPPPAPVMPETGLMTAIPARPTPERDGDRPR